MQEAHIDHAEVDQLVRKLLQSPKVIQVAKRQAIEMVAPKLKTAVQTEIGGSGRVQSWQEAYVGSKGGYAAARPKAKTWAESRGLQTYTSAGPKRYPVGYITNAINSGHRSRRAGKQIAGRQFYQRAQAKAEQVAQEAAGQIVQALIDHLEE